MSDQAELFPETRSDASLAAAAASQDVLRPHLSGTAAVSSPVPRMPGWALVGTRTGPVGYHRIQTASPNGSVLTVCQIVGRKIPDDATVIQECEACKS